MKNSNKSESNRTPLLKNVPSVYRGPPTSESANFESHVSPCVVQTRHVSVAIPSDFSPEGNVDVPHEIQEGRLRCRDAVGGGLAASFMSKLDKAGEVRNEDLRQKIQELLSDDSPYPQQGGGIGFKRPSRQGLKSKHLSSRHGMSSSIYGLSSEIRSSFIKRDSVHIRRHADTESPKHSKDSNKSELLSPDTQFMDRITNNRLSVPDSKLPFSHFDTLREDSRNTASDEGDDGWSVDSNASNFMNDLDIDDELEELDRGVHFLPSALVLMLGFCVMFSSVLVCGLILPYIVVS